MHYEADNIIFEVDEHNTDQSYNLYETNNIYQSDNLNDTNNTVSKTDEVDNIKSYLDESSSDNSDSSDDYHSIPKEDIGVISSTYSENSFKGKSLFFFFQGFTEEIEKI